MGLKVIRSGFHFFFIFREALILARVLVLVSMSGNYGQKSMYLVFLRIILYSSVHLYWHVTLLFSYQCLSNFTLIFFILNGLLNSILQYSLPIRLDSNLYLCCKREFKHENHIALSIKTIGSSMNLILHII